MESSDKSLSLKTHCPIVYKNLKRCDNCPKRPTENPEFSKAKFIWTYYSKGKYTITVILLVTSLKGKTGEVGKYLHDFIILKSNFQVNLARRGTSWDQAEFMT